MTPEKKALRKKRNAEFKANRAATRKQFLVNLGHVVIEKEVPVLDANKQPVMGEDGKQKTMKVLDFPPFIKTSADGTPLPFRGRYQRPPRLSWLSQRSGHPTRVGHNKNKSGRLQEYNAAIGEQGSRLFAQAVDAILNPPPVPTPEQTQLEAVVKQLEDAGLNVNPVGVLPTQEANNGNEDQSNQQE